MYRAVGSSITFPAVNITAGTVYDLRTVSQRLLLTYHGIGGVRPPYQLRAEFHSTIGRFVLRNLTEDDSDTYQQVVNMTVVAVIELYVIEPLQEPTLWKVNETRHGNQCYITLECRIQGAGPLNVTFLKDDKVITENIARMSNAIYLSLDVWDPGSSGAYTCRLGNVLENKTSPEIKIPTQDYDKCRNEILPLWAWIITILIVFSIVIGVIFFTVKEYLKRREIQSSRDSRTQNPPEVGQRSESYHNVPINDPEDSADPRERPKTV
ncbi:uncharacterized protein [Dendropsophus ebraccatus]|uniref:uncharacterized protein n=1 Tax=Dendropsophus ebraccatus TaxID=150705 RepID=UPI003831D885